MPETFNESWEYYCADPEIEEILEESSNRQLKTRSAETGLDYNALVGNQSFERSRIPKTQRRRLSADDFKVVAYLYTANVPLKEIARLTQTSLPCIDMRLRRINIVRNRKGPPLGSTVCLCGKEFPKRDRHTKFCSRKCAGEHHIKRQRECGNLIWNYPRKKYKPRSKSHKKKQVFSRMWSKGYTRSEIECKLFLSQITIDKWRKELGLPSRRKSHAVAN